MSNPNTASRIDVLQEQSKNHKRSESARRYLGMTGQESLQWEAL